MCTGLHEFSLFALRVATYASKYTVSTMPVYLCFIIQWTLWGLFHWSLWSEWQIRIRERSYFGFNTLWGTSLWDLILCRRSFNEGEQICVAQIKDLHICTESFCTKRATDGPCRKSSFHLWTIMFVILPMYDSYELFLYAHLICFLTFVSEMS